MASRMAPQLNDKELYLLLWWGSKLVGFEPHKLAAEQTVQLDQAVGMHAFCWHVGRKIIGWQRLP